MRIGTTFAGTRIVSNMAVRPIFVAKTFAHVLWLAPARPARQYFRRLIAGLARAHDAPAFEPHLTLGYCSAAMPADIGAAAIELPIAEIDSSAKFTKTLFVRFRLTPALEKLRESLGMPARGFDPHLSLLYKHCSAKERARLAATVALPFSKVEFDTIQLVLCPSPTASRADVESWKVLGSQRLRRRPNRGTTTRKLRA